MIQKLFHKRTSQVIIEGLFTTVTNVSFDDAAIRKYDTKSQSRERKTGS